jgi:hypothetical protein
MNIFIDADFKCHAKNDGTLREVDAPFFDGMCAEFIEGHRFIPSGETWTDSNGVTCRGEMVIPWKDCARLAKAQEEYEAQQKAIETEKRLKALEEENAMLMECLLEMSEIVYA